MEETTERVLLMSEIGRRQLFLYLLFLETTISAWFVSEYFEIREISACESGGVFFLKSNYCL